MNVFEPITDVFAVIYETDQAANISQRYRDMPSQRVKLFGDAKRAISTIPRSKADSKTQHDAWKLRIQSALISAHAECVKL